MIGILALPWQARDRALRPVVLISAIAFLVTSLLFPVATTWGTFLHAAAPGPRAAHRVGAGRAGRGPGPPRPAHGLDAADRVAGRRAGRRRLRAVRGRAACPSSRRRRRTPHAPTRCWPAQMAAIGAPLDGVAPGDPRLPHLARRDAARAGAGAPGRDARGRGGPRDGVRRPVADRRQGRPRRVARDPGRRSGPRDAPASRRSRCRSRPIPTRPAPSRTSASSASSAPPDRPSSRRDLRPGPRRNRRHGYTRHDGRSPERTGGHPVRRAACGGQGGDRVRREHAPRRPRPLSRDLPGRPVPVADARGRPGRPRARRRRRGRSRRRPGRPRRPRPAPPTSGCGRCAARWPGPAATWASTRRSCRAWTSRCATWSPPGCSWSAATRR